MCSLCGKDTQILPDGKHPVRINDIVFFVRTRTATWCLCGCRGAKRRPCPPAVRRDIPCRIEVRAEWCRTRWPIRIAHSCTARSTACFLRRTALHRHGRGCMWRRRILWARTCTAVRRMLPMLLRPRDALRGLLPERGRVRVRQDPVCSRRCLVRRPPDSMPGAGCRRVPNFRSAICPSL